ncbi:MAG: hypothetical protein KatS3mg076_0882 [Candidatus Binatia bacterium]|nr:MAG: hypothetical protein KatS3mg076_0882 [Candidatus Binatia bacterium]
MKRSGYEPTPSSAAGADIPPRATLLLLGLAAVKVFLHVVANLGDGYFRDEFYYVACSERLAWGYVDHPPLSIAVLALTRRLFGDSVLAIRLPAVLAGGFLVFLAGCLARRMGGAAFAQGLAALTVLAMPLVLAVDSFYSMNAFDLVFWTAGAYLFVLRVDRQDTRLWIPFGLVAGLGLLDKYSMGFFLFGLAAGMCLSRERRDFFRAPFWVGAALAALLFAPHVFWQLRHGFPTLEFMRNATTLKVSEFSPLEYLGAQILETNPGTLVVWLPGLLFLFFSARGRRFVALGVLYLVVLGLFLVQGGKPYYLGPAYPILAAAGGVFLERVSGSPLLRVGLVALVSVSGALLAPFGIPLLSAEGLVRYSEWLGLRAPAEERHYSGAVPQHLADRLGWEELVETVARTYRALPEADRERARIVGLSYGEAGAVDLLGRHYGLPPARSPHNSYWLWGPGDLDGGVVLVVGKISAERLEALFENVEPGPTVRVPYAVVDGTRIFVCRGLRESLPALWAKLKRFV